MKGSGTRRAGNAAQSSFARWLLCGATLSCAILLTTPAIAATYHANPLQSLSNWINTMVPGDTLILDPGDYYSSGTALYIANKVGTPTAWFTITAAAPNTVRILGNSGKNVCEMRNSAYWRFENLELDGRTLSSDGIKCTINTGNPDTDWCHDIVLDTLNIHDVTNAAINTQVTVWNLTVQNCWLHNIVGSAAAPGLGAYLGSPDHVQQIINLVFQHNIIERTGGYGMQVKAQNVRTGLTLGTTPGLQFTSWGWLIKDNVYMRTNPPALAGRPCLLIDAAPASGSGSTDLATIDGNIVLAQTADATADNAFQLSGNLRVVNNILMNTKAAPAIRIGLHDSTYPRRLELLNNTVFIDGSSGATCLSLYDLQSGYTQVIANNAFIRGSTNAPAVTISSLPTGAIVANNLVRGTGAITGMTTITTPIAQIFTGTTDVPGTANFYPVAGSPLIGAGTSSLPAGVMPTDDFNRVPRPSLQPVDVGAYRLYTATNPGWQIADAKKGFWVIGDIDGDHAVILADLKLLVASWNTVPGDPNFNSRADLDGDNAVILADLKLLVAHWNQTS